VLGLGAAEILLIGGALILLFGAKKIPGIARGVGESIRNFKGEMGAKPVDGAERPPSLGEGEREDGEQEPRE
jgi:sec-independent protein translocase protein TatA